MRRMPILAVPFLASVLVAWFPASAQAAYLRFTPSSVDFGFVPLGDSSTVPIVIGNDVGYLSETWVYVACVTNLLGADCPSGPGPFAYVEVDQLPRVIPSGESITLAVSFAPSGVGPVAAYLRVDTNEQDVTVFFIPLSGTGGTAVPEPSSVLLVLTGLGYLASRNRRRRR